MTYCFLLTKSEMVQSVSSRQSTTDSEPCGLRIGHINVYHLYNKVQDVCMLLTKSPCIHLLEPSETRLNSCVDNESLSIPNYTFFPRDAAHRGQTGIGLYVYKSIAHITKRWADLESERVECMWAEVKHSSSNATLVGYVYRNPAAVYAWFDDFVDTMDKDLFKSQPAWESPVSVVGTILYTVQQE